MLFKIKSVQFLDILAFFNKIILIFIKIHKCFLSTYREAGKHKYFPFWDEY